jgi:amidase
VIVKDNIDVAGLPMTSGFQGWKNYYPPEDAPLVKKIRAAGGIVLAKSSLSEFALGGGDNINSVVPGFSRNPYNTAYATGGSSGGTAAALAANFGVVGIGTDTGGSVRMPSAHNALAGLRPTVGLVSRTGMVPLNSVRDTAGPMARSVTDMAILAWRHSRPRSRRRGHGARRTSSPICLYQWIEGGCGERRSSGGAPASLHTGGY